MSIALDLGASCMRSLRQAGGRLVSRSCPAHYAACPDNPDRRRLLQRARIPFAVSDGDLVAAGDAASDLAQMFQTQTVSLWRDGRLPEDDPPARQLIAHIVDRLLPEPEKRGELCVFTPPGGSLEDSPAALFVSQLVRLKGYEPLCCRAAAALALAELSSVKCTGLAMVCGASSTEVSLWRTGQEVAACGLPRGGDWIDEELARRTERYTWDAAGNMYLDTNATRRLKEAVADPHDMSEAAVQIRTIVRELYAELIDHLLREMTSQWQPVPRLEMPLAPVSVICGGGAARWPGFAELVQWRSMICSQPLPLTIKDVRLVADSDFTVARGCLIAAELEGPAVARPARAA